MAFLDQPLNHTRVQRAQRSPLDSNPWKGPYRRPLSDAVYVIVTLAAFAAVGVLLAWRA